MRTLQISFDRLQMMVRTGEPLPFVTFLTFREHVAPRHLSQNVRPSLMPQGEPSASRCAVVSDELGMSTDWN